MSDELLAQTATSVLAHHGFGLHDGPAARRSAEETGWADDLWEAFAGTGLPWVSVPESAGGQGGEDADALVLLRVAGAHAAPLPLAENGLLGGWLLAAAGLNIPYGVVTAAPGRVRLARGALSGELPAVPWARRATWIVALADGGDGAWHVAAVDPAACALEHRANLAGEPRDRVVLDAVEPLAVAPAPAGVDPGALELRGALSRVALVAGALESVRDLTVRYTATREQFGRPVGRFQAVQVHLVECAAQAALVRMALDVATAALTPDPRAAVFEIAAAKALADRAAGLVARAAHQAHGAIGVTREYALQDFTRRLWSWRQEYGGRPRWLRRLGRTALGAGPEGLYPLVAGS